jgi:hypothetical protein
MAAFSRIYVMSQPEDSGEHRKKLVQALADANLVPRQKKARPWSELEEQIYVIGQLTAKLEVQGVSAGVIGRLRNARFVLEAVQGEIAEPDRTLLASRDVDETLYRIQQALHTVELLTPQGKLSEASKGKATAGIRKMIDDDGKRAEIVKQIRDGRSGDNSI